MDARVAREAKGPKRRLVEGFLITLWYIALFLRKSESRLSNGVPSVR
jgi:hypothetical protein